MAMDGPTLGTAINAAITALSSTDQANPLKCWQALAGAVVAHIHAAATVTIQTTDAALQRDNTAGNPATLGPAVNKTLPAGCIS